MILHKLRRCESGLLNECALQILRCAQDDKIPGCHPERSEGSIVDLLRNHQFHKGPSGLHLWLEHDLDTTILFMFENVVAVRCIIQAQAVSDDKRRINFTLPPGIKV